MWPAETEGQHFTSPWELPVTSMNILARWSIQVQATDLFRAFTSNGVTPRKGMEAANNTKPFFVQSKRRIN